MMEDPLIEKNNGLNDMSADDGGSSHNETEYEGFDADSRMISSPTVIAAAGTEGSMRSDALTAPLAQYKPYDVLGLRQRQTQLRSEAAGYGGTSSSAAISKGVETQDLSSRFKDEYLRSFWDVKRSDALRLAQKHDDFLGSATAANSAANSLTYFSEIWDGVKPQDLSSRFKDDDYLDEVSQMISSPTVIAGARTACNLNLGTAGHTEPISVHGKWKSWSQKMDFEWIFVITNIVLESMSAIFTQLSSKQEPQYALFGMLLSYFALLTCIIELIYEDRRHQQIPIRRWRGTWYYDRPQRRKSFATLNNIVALACALVQCVVTTINYRFENPIKVTVLPIFLAFGVLFSKTVKYRQREAL